MGKEGNEKKANPTNPNQRQSYAVLTERPYIIKNTKQTIDDHKRRRQGSNKKVTTGSTQISHENKKQLSGQCWHGNASSAICAATDIASKARHVGVS